MKAKVYYSTLWVYTFLEHIFVFCVMYKVFIVYCTLSRTEKSSVNKEDFRLKWDLMQQNPFFNSLKLKFNSIKFGSIRFQFFVFLSIVYQNTLNPKATRGGPNGPTFKFE